MYLIELCTINSQNPILRGFILYSSFNNQRTCDFPGMADSVEEILEERNEERIKTERLREHRLVRAAAVEPVVKSMNSEERDTIGRMVQQLGGTLRLDTETLARFEPEELRRYLGMSMGSANG